ncbi:Mas-related G-protein coupled receptor member D [Bacillus sp. YC2]|uniref:Mas-related G-protein coupled receptor member D n=1 Tax=Bacillus sp. YC2 TaxID=2861287 RepID=UPI001CA697F4|nr:Mas-related G-protein coupled receptor member D [Bacillus sp. YC2]MBY8913787.1 Mas-related G-protein coupled receptor member D [Bacillus sp. YC2]
MEQIIFVVSMIALGVTLFTFIGIILNGGVKGVLNLSKKPVKLMMGSFIVYIVSFVFYILVSSSFS